MQMWKKLTGQLRKMHKFSKNVIIITLGLTFSQYICSLAARLYAPYVPDYHRAMGLADCLAEAAIATLVAGIIASIISDLAFASRGNSGRNDDK